MLNTITWGQFISFILPLLIIYYLVVMLKYYRHDLIAFFSGRREPTRAELAASQMPVVSEKVAEKVVETAPVQPGLFDRQDGRLPDGVGVDNGGQSPEMFKVMAAVVAILKEVVAEGVAERIDKEQLVSQIKDVLSRYGQLKRTPYQGSINSFLARTCASNFSLVFEEEELMGLWG